MVTLTFYSGMVSIGGTVIAIESDNHRILYDFGYSFNPLFDEALKPRAGKELYDKLMLKSIPEVEGIYSKKDLRSYPLTSLEESDKKTLFFISHMHLDHMASLSHIASDIPIYMSPESKRLYEAMVVYGEHDELPNLLAKDFHDTFDFGPFKLTIYPVDHDVPGASALKVDTAEGSITYTGDYRFHGHNMSLTPKFIEEVKGSDVLITEGVTVSFADDDTDLTPEVAPPEDTRNEASLIQDFATYLDESKGHVFFDIYNRNVYRVLNLIDLSITRNTDLYLEPSTAVLVSKFSDRKDFKVINYGDSLIDLDKQALRYIKENDLYDVVDFDDFIKDETKSFIQLSYPYLPQLIEYNKTGSVFIHSNGAPLGSYDPAYERMINFLENLNVPFNSLPCGGHAHPRQLTYLIDQIKPANLVPYHSFAPQRLTNGTRNRVLPKPGQIYKLSQGELTLI